MRRLAVARVLVALLLTAALGASGPSDAVEGLPIGTNVDYQLGGVDFAVSESCAQLDECDAYVEDFGDQVLMVEYRLLDFREACRRHGDRLAIVLRDLDLTPDGVRRWC